MKTKIIVDSNIAFSALLNTNSRIGQILFGGEKYYKFIAPEYIKYEIIEHQQKIKKIANITDNEFLELFELIIRKFTIINHSIIPLNFYKKAYTLCHKIDINDTVFVAYALYFNGLLWTGDKKLIRGLHKTAFSHFTSTKDLYLDFIKKEKAQR